MGKLTLSVDDGVVANAKRYAKQRGVSVSELVEAYLAAVAEPPVAEPGNAPVLRSVRGVLKGSNREEYRRHLSQKYQ
jgi:hypothetical protein